MWRRWPEAIRAMVVPAEGGGDNSLDWRWKTSRMGQVSHGAKLSRAVTEPRRRAVAALMKVPSMRSWIFCGARACVLPGGLGSRVGMMAQWNKPREWGGSLAVGFVGWHTGWATSGPKTKG
jgi:hypothetical protein